MQRGNRFESLATEDAGNWATVGSGTVPASPTSCHAKAIRNPSNHGLKPDSAAKRLDLDWRKPKPSQYSTASRQAPPRSTANPSRVSQSRKNGGGGHARFHQSYKITNANPNIKKLYGKDFFQPGLIIRADLHEEDFKSSRNATNGARSASPPGGAIHTKERKMIVVACYERHYICIPLYSHEGYGLKNKNEAEYISVRDHRTPLSEFKPLSSHGTLTTEFLHDGLELFFPATAAHITYPVSRNYDLAVVHEGHLVPADLDRLVKLFNRFAPRRG